MPMVQDFFDKERVRSPTASENLLVHWTVRVQVPLSPNSYFIQLFLKGNSGTKALFVCKQIGKPSSNLRLRGGEAEGLRLYRPSGGTEAESACGVDAREVKGGGL